MTVATTVLGLLPLLWEAGAGADVSARTAAPVVGVMSYTLLVLAGGVRHVAAPAVAGHADTLAACMPR